MKDIKDKISAILSLDDTELSYVFEEEEIVETNDEFEYEELYTDLYVLVKNIDQFYGKNANQKAALLVESFLLETMVLLKKDPENIVVESGEFYVKSTGFTPDGEVLITLFEDAVLVNSMMEIYNEALAEADLPRMEVGIGLATFAKEEFDEESDDEGCGCGCGCCSEEECNDEECDCEHDHDHDDEFDYGIDYNNTASLLAEIANSEELDPIVMNDVCYDLLSEYERDFFENHLESFTLEDDMVIYHGNIVSEE